jgi:hypothetical protein
MGDGGIDGRIDVDDLPSANLVLENIGFVFPSMFMIVIGYSLLY